jgi:hypothetical protein
MLDQMLIEVIRSDSFAAIEFRGSVLVLSEMLFQNTLTVAFDETRRKRVLINLWAHRASHRLGNPSYKIGRELVV